MRRECCSAEKYCTINFEETELRLGVGVPLPRETTTTASSTTKNGDSDSDSKVNSAKRVFSDTVDLKLNLQITNPPPPPPPAKAQVVGWPPVRSFRKNIMSVQKTAGTGKDGERSGAAVAPTASFVKVSLDGAPYLRKVDLKLYKSYTQLSDALTKMFTIGKCGSQGMKELMNESKLIDLLNDSDYVPTYEDKDGDWMLVGDVPWEMFVDSCKRLRIMKGSEAIGLASKSNREVQEKKLISV